MAADGKTAYPMIARDEEHPNGTFPTIRFDVGLSGPYPGPGLTPSMVNTWVADEFLRLAAENRTSLEVQARQAMELERVTSEYQVLRKALIELFNSGFSGDDVRLLAVGIGGVLKPEIHEHCDRHNAARQRVRELLTKDIHSNDPSR